MNEHNHKLTRVKALLIGAVAGFVTNLIVSYPFIMDDGLWLWYYVLPFGTVFGSIGGIIAHRNPPTRLVIIIGGVIGGIGSLIICGFLYTFIGAFMGSNN